MTPAPVEPKTPLGAAIRKYRMRRRWDQQTLAERLGVTQSNVSDWERGRHAPSLSLLMDIAATLGVPLNRLLK
jgi:transcriptional regulator with XRE-family HTH domain